MATRRSSVRSPRLIAVAALVLLGLHGGALPAAAQAPTQELINRIDRLQQELSTLQGYVYRGGTGAPPAGARAPVVTSQPGLEPGSPAAAQLSVRLTQMESELRRLTGQNEEFGHSIRQLQSRLDKLVGDVDARLAALERRAGVSGQAPAEGGATALAEEARSAAAPTAAAPARSGTPAGPGQGPQVLGTLRVDPATGQPVGGSVAPRPAAPPAPQQAARTSETPQQLYDRAQALLLKEQNVGEAERVLKEFLQKYPDHALAGNAHYWLGRTYFVREDFQQAAFTFADAFQKYPKSDKAAANLLNLGMSLSRLGKTREACTAYQRLLQNFPNAEDAIKRRATSERQRAKCG